MPICEFTWELVKNANSGLFLRLAESESPGWRFRNCHELLPGKWVWKSLDYVEHAGMTLSCVTVFHFNDTALYC